MIDQFISGARNEFAEQLFGAFVEHGEDGVFIVQKDATITYVNAKMSDLFGYSVDEFIGKPFLDFWAPEFQSLGKERYQARIAGSEPLKRYAVDMVRKDGSRLPVEVTAFRIVLQGVPADAVVVRDISDHRQLESELRDTLGQYRELALVVEKSFDAIVLTDSEGIITYANESWQRLNGWTLADIAGKVTPRVIKSGKQDAEFYRSFWQKIKQGEIVRVNVVNRRKDGTEYDAELIVLPLKDEHDAITGFAGFQHDVTAYKRTQQELLDAKEFAEHVINSANAMVVVLDNNGTIQLFNRRAEEMTGYTKEYLKDRNWFEVLVPKDRYPDVWRLFAEYQKHGAVAQQFENPILTKDGRELIIAWENSELIRSGKSTGTISFGIDITERKKMEEQLMTTNRDLQKFKDLMVGRELKMIELKKELKALRLACEERQYDEKNETVQK